MIITARVHNRTIALPADVEIAEGAEVQVIVPEKVPAKSQPKGKHRTGCGRQAGPRPAD